MKKYIINIAVIVLLFVVSVMVDFMTVSWETAMTWDYWLGVITTQIPVIAVLFAARELFKTREAQTDKTHIGLKNTLHASYKGLTNSGLTERFDYYIENDNRIRKLTAYKDRLNRKKARLSAKINKIGNRAESRQIRLKQKNAKKLIKRGGNASEAVAIERNPFYKLMGIFCEMRLDKLECKKKLVDHKLNSADESISYLKVRYSRVCRSVIFGESEKKYQDDKDLNTHESREVISILISRVIIIVAVGVIMTSFLIWDVNGEIFDIVYKAAMKVLQMVWSVVMGKSVGQNYVKGELTDKLRNRVDYVQVFFDKVRAERGIIITIPENVPAPEPDEEEE